VGELWDPAAAKGFDINKIVKVKQYGNNFQQKVLWIRNLTDALSVYTDN